MLNCFFTFFDIEIFRWLIQRKLYQFYLWHIEVQWIFTLLVQQMIMEMSHQIWKAGFINKVVNIRNGTNVGSFLKDLTSFILKVQR